MKDCQFGVSPVNYSDSDSDQIYFPLRFFNGGNNHFQGSRNNVMITESVGGVNVNKLTRKGSDNQVQSVSFSCREVHYQVPVGDNGERDSH